MISRLNVFFIKTVMFVFAVFVVSCGSINTKTIKSNLDKALMQPRFVEGELVLVIDSIKTLKGEKLKEFNIAHSIPEDQKPTLLVWSSKIKGRKTQKDIKTLECSPEPSYTFTDTMNGNIIDFWDLSDSVTTYSKIVIRRKFSYTTYDYKPPINKKLIEEKWGEIPLNIKTRYTKSELFLPTNDEIESLSMSITAGISNHVDKTYAIYKWLQKNLIYVYPPRKRGALEVLQTRKGDCGQYSNLFISLCRAAGIPARQQSGFNFIPGNTGYHAWSEVYLPVYGWVPVDATRKDGFCHLDNKRLIASVGMNIPLEKVPLWASKVTDEIINGNADFMQLATIVASGLDFRIKTERNILTSRLIEKQ